MKKLIFFPLTLAFTACSGFLGLLDTESTDDPTDNKVQDVLENTFWGTAGATIPKGYQEMNLFHVTLSEGEDFNESAVTDVIFKDNSITFVFPGGGWRTATYTFDEERGVLKFNKPLIYGTKSFGGKDIYECRFVSEKIFGEAHVALFDVSVDDWQKVDIKKEQWRLTLAPMNERQNEKLKEIDCIYGTSYKANGLGIEGGAFWAYENVDGGKLFPKPDLDLGEVYYGLDYTMPTEEQAQRLIDNCFSVTHRNSSGDEYIVVGNESGALRFPKPQAPGEQLGFWLADGSALIYSYGEDKTTDGDFICTLSILPSSATASREFAVRPVLKQ